MEGDKRMGERKKKRRRKPVGIATVVIPALCDPEAEGAPVPGIHSETLSQNKPTKNVLGDELCYPVTL